MICPRDAELVEANEQDKQFFHSISADFMSEDELANFMGYSNVDAVHKRQRAMCACQCNKCRLKRLRWSIETFIAQIFYWKPRRFWYNLQNKIEQRGKHEQTTDSRSSL